MWYPQKKEQLESELDRFLSKKTNIPVNGIHGLIVPHAGYDFSGEIAGKAFSKLKKHKINRAVIIAPSHYVPLRGILTSNKKEWNTPLGEISLFNEKFDEGEIEREHAIDNQVPFLQRLGFKELLPLMIGELTENQAVIIAEKLSKIQAVFIFSTDLSHFLPYETAVKKDKETIKLIENLNLESFHKIDACGFYPLLIMMHLCKLRGWKPRLIEYKNSGDITGDKAGVVGYATFWF
jgi:AmmeMemoRadiSam system protein B